MKKIITLLIFSFIIFTSLNACSQLFAKQTPYNKELTGFSKELIGKWDYEIGGYVNSDSGFTIDPNEKGQFAFFEDGKFTLSIIGDTDKSIYGKYTVDNNGRIVHLVFDDKVKYGDDTTLEFNSSRPNIVNWHIQFKKNSSQNQFMTLTMEKVS
jgi:hypothetical protein